VVVVALVERLAADVVAAGSQVGLVCLHTLIHTWDDVSCFGHSDGVY